MILCFQGEDLTKILLVSKFETNNWPNVKLIIPLPHILINVHGNMVVQSYQLFTIMLFDPFKVFEYRQILMTLLR